MIRPGDWVMISSSISYFHGEIAEVISVLNPESPDATALLAISRTPGHEWTRWFCNQLTLLPNTALEILGEDYFA